MVKPGTVMFEVGGVPEEVAKAGASARGPQDAHQVPVCITQAYAWIEIEEYNESIMKYRDMRTDERAGKARRACKSRCSPAVLRR